MRDGHHTAPRSRRSVTFIIACEALHKAKHVLESLSGVTCYRPKHPRPEVPRAKKKGKKRRKQATDFIAREVVNNRMSVTRCPSGFPHTPWPLLALAATAKLRRPPRHSRMPQRLENGADPSSKKSFEAPNEIEKKTRCSGEGEGAHPRSPKHHKTSYQCSYYRSSYISRSDISFVRRPLVTFEFGRRPMSTRHAAKTTNDRPAQGRRRR